MHAELPANGAWSGLFKTSILFADKNKADHMVCRRQKALSRRMLRVGSTKHDVSWTADCWRRMSLNRSKHVRCRSSFLWTNALVTRQSVLGRRMCRTKSMWNTHFVSLFCLLMVFVGFDTGRLTVQILWLWSECRQLFCYSAFIRWTGYTLAMTVNIVLSISTILNQQKK